MEGEAWGAIDFEPNIDESEDFDLSSSENSKTFGSPLSQKALDQAISDCIPAKTRKANTMGSQCVSCMVRCSRRQGCPSKDVLADLLAT